LSTRPLHKVLYIEDDPHMRQLVQLTLEEIGGLTVRACGSWKEAIAWAGREVPDVFLLDVMLPEKNGVETLAALRELPGMACVPAIFLTVDVDFTTAETARLGPYAVIAKPFAVDQLYPTLLAQWDKLQNSVD